MSWFLLASSLGVATLVLPPGEDPRGWESPAQLAGLAVGARGGGVWVEVEAHGVTWTLRARGADGAERSLEILAPRDAAGREDAVWLAASLVRALPPVAEGAATGAGAPRSAPGAATSPGPVPTRESGVPLTGPTPELSQARLSSGPSPHAGLDHPASPGALSAGARTDAPTAEREQETPRSSTVPTLVQSTEVTERTSGGPDQAPGTLSTGTALPVGPGEPSARGESGRVSPVELHTVPPSVPSPEPPGASAGPVGAAGPVSAAAPVAAAGPVPAAAPVAPTASMERAAPAVGPYLGVRTAVAWRAGAPAGPSLGAQAGVRVGRGVTLGAGADWGPPTPLDEMGETAAAASWEALGAAGWCPHDRVAPCVGVEAGAALRRYLLGAETLTRFAVPVLGVRVGLWVPLGAHFGLSPYAAAVTDLASTRLQRGDDPEVEQAALRVSAGLSWTAAPR